MGVYKAAVVTQNGQNMIAQALAENRAILFTSAKTSSYAYPLGTDITALAGLEGIVQSVGPSSTQVINDNVAQVSVRFDNEGITRRYLIQTIGLYAELEDGEEILFSVIQAEAPDEMPIQSDVSPSAFIYNIQLAVRNVSEITMIVNPAGTASIQDVLNVVNPEFDDSGVVDTINSFPDFLDTFKSKMNLFRFLRNLKAGSQFVLHRGQVVDNCETEAEDLPLSARQGKVLMEMSGKLGSDFIHVLRAFTEPITVVIPASGWSDTAPFLNRVDIEGMHEEDNVDVTFVPAEEATNEENIAAWDGYVNINYCVTEDGAMVFHAFETKPEVDVMVAVKGMIQREETEPENPEGSDSTEESTDPGDTDAPEITDTPENQEIVEGG